MHLFEIEFIFSVQAKIPCPWMRLFFTGRYSVWRNMVESTWTPTSSTWTITPTVSGKNTIYKGSILEIKLKEERDERGEIFQLHQPLRWPDAEQLTSVSGNVPGAQHLPDQHGGKVLRRFREGTVCQNTLAIHPGYGAITSGLQARPGNGRNGSTKN